MNRQDVAIVINTCPKYFYLLEPCLGLLRRYAERCQWPVYLATEKPDHPDVLAVASKYNVSVLVLDSADSDFLQSRAAAVRLLGEEIHYVLPLQEDFLLERLVDTDALTQALEILDADPQVQSLRLMPCPGSTTAEGFWGRWHKLMSADLIFSYQATLWRRELFQRYMDGLIQQGFAFQPNLRPCTREWNEYCIRVNPAETFPGFQLLRSLYPDAHHLCWPRKGRWANAVYWCPWPYRPTAVVQGVLQPWATELIRREGFLMRQS